MAQCYAQEFLDVFSELGVAYQLLRAREFYRDGTMNEAIERILHHAHIAREVYLEVSNAKRPEHWHPFQVICENCGKVGTTEVNAFDGKEVTYHCRPDLVKWAKGCDHRGKISPYNGNGKLPWKLEWGAKWHVFKVGIEGCGKDHSTKGGSRDVAEACYRRIFHATPPINIPYEFFLVGGAKMSSSKGLGHSARDMADLLPPELLRFLMINTPPRRAIDFDPQLDYMVKLFNEYDALVEKHLSQRANASEASVLRLSSVDGNLPSTLAPNFQLLYALSQLPHLSAEQVITERDNDGKALSEADRIALQSRLKTVKLWIDKIGSPEDKLIIQTELSPRYHTLSHAQKAFLKHLETLLIQNDHSDKHQADSYQSVLFDAARLTPIPPAKAFEAFYALLLNRQSGPKGGALIHYLGTAPLLSLLAQVSVDEPAYWNEVAITPEAYHAWLTKLQQKEPVQVQDGATKYHLTEKLIRTGDKLLRQIVSGSDA